MRSSTWRRSSARGRGATAKDRGAQVPRRTGSPEGFGREEIVRDVVLAGLPPTPAPFGSADAELCAELLGWTLGLLGEEPSEALLALLKSLPVACHGGWRPARVKPASAPVGRAAPE